MKRTTNFACLALAFLLLLPGAPALADTDAETPSADAPACTITLPEAEAAHLDRLTDGNVNTRVSLAPEETIALSWAGDGAAALSVAWYTPPVTAAVAFFDAQGVPLSTVTVDDGLYTSCIPVPKGARAAVLTASDTAPAPTPAPYGSRNIKITTKTMTVSELRLLTAAEASKALQPTVPEKADLMLIGAHTGDEQAYFSGLLPAYAGERGLESVTVFLSHENRFAQENSIEAQRLCGESNQPVFLSMYYRFLESAELKRARAFWGDTTVLPLLVDAIRRYRPEVIVTNAMEGEAGDAMHAWTAMLVQQAVDLAATKTDKIYAASYAAYGTWQVKKLYLHDDAGTCAPRVDEPLDLFGDKTAGELASQALVLYSGLRLYHPSTDPSPRYTLAMTQVGDDTEHNDLFEHIDSALLAGASPTPRPTATPDPTPAATETPLPKSNTAPADDSSGALFPCWPLLAGAGLAAAYVGVYLLILRKHVAHRIEKKSLRVLLCAVPAAILLLTGLFLTLRMPRPAAAVQLAAPSAPPAATPVTTASPSPAPADTPHPFAAYFRSESDPAEVVVVDADTGHWEYRTDTLSILIDRHEDTSIPLVWLVAHIRMRDVDAFRPGFGGNDECGSARERPWRLVRKARAVLAITGDNLIQKEDNMKGILIRKGRIYNSSQRQDTMAFLPGLDMKIYFMNEADPQEILEDGVENTFGFGPTLVYDGKVLYGTEGTPRHRTRGKNPRSGLGMVEPGHFVAIVVDGRQPNYSIGIPMEAYAQLFIDEGCTVAYNMDGGISAGMIFMGESLGHHRSSSATNFSSQRPWPDALMWGYSELVPTIDDPIYNTGNKNEIITPLPSGTPAVTPAP